MARRLLSWGTSSKAPTPRRKWRGHVFQRHAHLALRGRPTSLPPAPSRRVPTTSTCHRRRACALATRSSQRLPPRRARRRVPRGGRLCQAVFDVRKSMRSDSSARVPGSAFELRRASSGVLSRLMPGAPNQRLHARGADEHERSVDFPAAASASATRHTAGATGGNAATPSGWRAGSPARSPQPLTESGDRQRTGEHLHGDPLVATLAPLGGRADVCRVADAYARPIRRAGNRCGVIHPRVFLAVRSSCVEPAPAF
jgi:hypothetical protein